MQFYSVHKVVHKIKQNYHALQLQRLLLPVKNHKLYSKFFVSG